MGTALPSSDRTPVDAPVEALIVSLARAYGEHPYDDYIPAPWVPCLGYLDHLRDSFARVSCRLIVEGHPTAADDVLVEFAAVDAAVDAARLAYRARPLAVSA
jgi:hypothetical protein